MTKQEFLIQLQKALNGRAEPGLIQEHVRYYDEYISMQMRKGQTEEQILEELGDPRLLAKSIAAAKESKAEQEVRSRREEPAGESGRRILRIPGWVLLLVVLLVFFLLLYVVGAVASLLLPVLVPVLLLGLLFRYWRRK